MFFSSAENVATPGSWCAAENSGNETTQTCFHVPLGWNAQKHNKKNHDLTVKSESGKKKKNLSSWCYLQHKADYIEVNYISKSVFFRDGLVY